MDLPGFSDEDIDDLDDAPEAEVQAVEEKVVDERLAVVRDFAHYVAQVDVGDLSLAAVAVNGVVDVALSHLGDGPHAKLKSIARARSGVDQALIHMGLVDQAGLPPHGGHGRIVWMSRQSHA